MSARSTIAAVAILLTTNSYAQVPADSEYENFNDPFRIYVRGFYPQMDSEITINGEVVTPPPLDIEAKLGLKEGELVGWGGAKWHISRRNSLEAEYFALNRDGFVDLFPEPIEVGDLVIESGSISTAFDVAVARLTYGFSLKRSERTDLQLKAGLHIADMSIGLQLAGAVCDRSVGEFPPGCPTGQTPPLESEEVTAPLPHFGLSWAYAISPTVMTEVRAMGFAIEIDNVDGSLIEVSGDLFWQPWDNFGLGLGLRYFDLGVKASKADLNGEFNLYYFGPAVSVVASF